MNENDIFDVVKPKTKLFGERAERVTTAEMRIVFNDIYSYFRKQGKIARMDLSKPLPSKTDHGDIDIVVENLTDEDTKEYIADHLWLELRLEEKVENGPILHCLYQAFEINKMVHVDFICASKEEYDSTLMYLAYNDFSGLLGVVARKLKFNYGNKGFYKIYIDKKGQYHYILLTRNLVDGLKMMGYGNVIHDYYNIQHNEDIAKFIGYSDLFDSNHLIGSDLNRGDRKRMRAGRPSARDLKEKLVALNKSRTQMDDDYYVKTLFPDVYADYLAKCKAIEDYVPVKCKYNGNWILKNFPSLKPGPIIGKIQLYWLNLYGDRLDDVDENELFEKTKQIIP